jgi:hypothetical protein
MKPIQHLIMAVGVVGGIGIARADEDAAAAFARGQAALKANKVHEACEAFAASEKAKPAVDTELALGSCYEQDGKLVAASKTLRAAADKDVNASRKKASLDKAGKLEARAPKLRFAINPKPDGIAIKVDGMEVPSTGDVMVDVGPHEVTATAPGYEGHANAPVDREGQTLDVILRMEAKAPEPAPAPAPAPAPSPTAAPAPAPAPAVAPMPEQPMPAAEGSSSRRRTGMIVGGAGVAALIGAVVFYELGTSKFDDEHSLCPGHLCASDADTAKANSLRDDGRTLRGVSIGVGIGGLALVAAGSVLFATSHHESSPVAFHVDHHGAVVTYTFGF